VLHPCVDTPELRAFATDWTNRVDDHRHATAAGRLRAALKAQQVELIGYEPLRALQRDGNGP
jgi:hypothetical protein